MMSMRSFIVPLVGRPSKTRCRSPQVLHLQKYLQSSLRLRHRREIWHFAQAVIFILVGFDGLAFVAVLSAIGYGITTAVRRDIDSFAIVDNPELTTFSTAVEAWFALAKAD